MEAGDVREEPAWNDRWYAGEGEGKPYMSLARTREGFLLRFENIADFLISKDLVAVRCRPRSGCPADTVRHLLLDQVLPRVLCHLGRVVVHASAVELDTGQVVAFTGPSGRGKSTLAGAFFRAGHTVYSDDCLLLDVRADGVHATPAYPSLRLWPDAAGKLLDEIGPDAARLAEMAHYTNKKQLLFGDGDARLETPRRPLTALFLLEPPENAPADGIVEFLPAGGMQRMVALIESLFALDVRRKSLVQKNFERAGDVARAVPVYRLAYRRSFDLLPGIIGAIERKITGLP